MNERYLTTRVETVFGDSFDFALFPRAANQADVFSHVCFNNRSCPFRPALVLFPSGSIAKRKSSCAFGFLTWGIGINLTESSASVNIDEDEKKISRRYWSIRGRRISWAKTE